MAGLKSLAKDTAIYGLSSIIGRFLNWLLVPLYTEVFAPGEYGSVTFLYAGVAILMILLTYGMETGFFRFANREGVESPFTVYTTTLTSLAVTSVAFVIGVLLLLDPIANTLGYADHPDYIWLLAIIVAIDAFTAIPFAYLRYQKRPIRFASIKLLSIGINIAFNLFFFLVCPYLYTHHADLISWFYLPEYGIGYIFVANLLSSLVVLIALIPEFLGFKYRCDIVLLKQILRYSLPLVVLGVAGIMNQTLDKLLYPLLVSDPSEAMHGLGIYGANYKIAIVMVMFMQAFRYAYEPFIFAQNKGSNNEKSYSDAMKYFIIFGLFIFLGVMFYIDIIKHFISSSYYEGLRVVPIVMMAELFFGIFFNLSLWYKLTDRTAYGAWFSLFGCFITVAINVLFVPHFGYIACAWAAFSCYLAMMVVSYFVGQRYYPIKYDLRSAALFTLLALVLYGVSEMVRIDSLYIRLAFRTLLLLPYCVAVVISMRRQTQCKV